jgi:GWxTD domain-containing protein
MAMLQGSRIHRIIGLVLFALVATPALAGLSPDLDAWARGPAQWIMTSEEKRAWRRVTTDDEANQFINLFWARRDPTPATKINEFKREFESRVTFCDEQFDEPKKRGAMTDRGRVYVVLGESATFERQAGGGKAQRVMSAIASVKTKNKTNREGFDGRTSADTVVWIWDYPRAQAFDMGKIEVVFVEDRATGRYLRDPQRPDFSRAEATAIRKAIVNPELTIAPVIVEVPAAPPVASVAPAPDVPPMTAAPGASRLTLFRDASIDATAPNPFAVRTETSFLTIDSARWAIQHCPATDEAPRLTSMLMIRGPLDARATDAITRARETKATAIDGLTGCYFLQGSIPVSSLVAGRYSLSVVIEDIVTKQSWILDGEFRVE